MTKYCQRLLNVFVGKPVWYCWVSFCTLPSASWLKWTCLGPYSHKIPANSYFYVNNVELLKQLPLGLIDASQYFFHYQLETYKQSRPQSNLKKIALAPHNFAGNFYLIWFVNCKIIEINLYNAVNFPWWLIKAINTTWSRWVNSECLHMSKKGISQTKRQF